MKILTLGLFCQGDPEDDKLRKDDWCEFIFDSEDVACANKGTYEGTTILRFKSGYDQTVAISWEDFKNQNPCDKIIIDKKIAYENGII